MSILKKKFIKEMEREKKQTLRMNLQLVQFIEKITDKIKMVFGQNIRVKEFFIKCDRFWDNFEKSVKNTLVFKPTL